MSWPFLWAFIATFYALLTLTLAKFLKTMQPPFESVPPPSDREIDSGEITVPDGKLTPAQLIEQRLMGERTGLVHKIRRKVNENDKAIAGAKTALLAALIYTFQNESTPAPAKYIALGTCCLWLLWSLRPQP